MVKQTTANKSLVFILIHINLSIQQRNTRFQCLVQTILLTLVTLGQIVFSIPIIKLIPQVRRVVPRDSPLPLRLLCPLRPHGRIRQAQFPQGRGWQSARHMHRRHLLLGPPHLRLHRRPTPRQQDSPPAGVILQHRPPHPPPAHFLRLLRLVNRHQSRDGSVRRVLHLAIGAHRL